MTEVLVTGALGNVGGATASALLRRGTGVRVADRDVAALADRFPQAELVHLDFLNEETFAPAVSGVDKLFLLRPPPISRVGPTLNRLVEVAVARGVGHIVFSSVAGAESNRIVPHHRVEQHIFGSGAAWTILRPGYFAQNIETAYRRDIVADGRLFVPAGAGLVAFIDTRDIGDVAAETLTGAGHHGMAYHLTGPEALSFVDVARMLSEALGRPIVYEPAGVLEYARHLLSQGLAVPHALVQTVLHVGLRRGDAEAVTGTVEEVLGREPRALRSYIEEKAEVWSG